MSIETLPLSYRYSYAREHFASVWNQVNDTRQPVTLQRRGYDALALINAADLASLQETAYLMQSPANAARLLTALHRANTDDVLPQSIQALREAMGL